MQYGAVVFDLFHTLVDPEDFRPKNYHRIDAMAEILGVPQHVMYAYWHETYGERATNTKPSIEYLKVFRHDGENPIPDSTLEKAAFEIGRYQDLAIMNPRPDVLSALEALKSNGFRLGLLSNAEEGETQKWATSPLAHYFDSTVFSYQIGFLKPEQQTYAAILKKLGTKAPNAVFVADGRGGELLGAKRANFGLVVFMEKFIGVNGLRTPMILNEFRSQADLTVQDYEGLLTALIRNKKAL